MSPTKALTELTSMPGVLGVVTCSQDGGITYCAGDEAELLGGVLGHLDQTSRLIGECLGLESLQEVRLMGKTLTAVCFPRGDELCGVLVDRKAQLADVLARLPTV
jgi:hypothetical protein